MVEFGRTEFSPDRAVMEFEIGPRHANPQGSLHGGVLCYVADMAMGMAWASGVAAGETFSTIELKINFFRPVWKGRLTADAKVVRRGKTVGYVECEVKDEQGRLVAKSSSTCMTFQGDAVAGRKERAVS